MVSIVVVSFRSSEVLGTCLENLIGQLSNTDEVIVIENSGDSKILQLPQMRDDKVVTIINTINTGYTAACNQGISMSKNNWILLLNPDAIAANNAIDRLKESLAFRRKDELLCVELVNPDGSRQDYYRRFPSVRALLVMFFLPSSVRNHFHSYKRYTYHKEFTTRISFEQPPGAGLVISKRHQLDEDFFVYGSDLHLCWQYVKHSGQEISILPSKFYHLRGQGGTASSPDLADALRIESALGFSRFFLKSKQYLRFFAWNVLYASLEFGGITKELLSGNSPRNKSRRFIAFIRRESWLRNTT
jgi:GT2 family glycosyltransferase